MKYEAGCYLYRFFDADGHLLYVGITSNPENRFRGHAKHSPWFCLADHHEIEWHPSRVVASEEEEWAIFEERPAFNKASRLNDARRRVLRARAH